MEWKKQGACVGQWELFDGYEVPGEDHLDKVTYYYPHLEAAKDICKNDCPVFALCDEAGKRASGGIWAGKVRK